MNTIKRKIMAIALTAAVCVTCFTSLEAYARDKEQRSTPDWTENTTVWDVSDGVTAYISDGILYFEGNGAIPDYTNDNLADRPWHTSIFGTVVVGTGITDIGARAFAEFPNLRYFFIPSTTFISSSTAFHKIDSKPVIRIQGSEETTRMIGDKIPYTSLDSWAAVAQSMSHNTLYITDDGTMKNYFRKKTYPNIANVYSSDNPDIEKVSDLADREEEQLEEFVSPLRFAAGYEMSGRAVTSKRVKTGTEYLELIAYYLNYMYPDYSYGETYSNMVTTGDTEYAEFDSAKNYVFQIPAELQSPGREFKVIQVVDGQPTVLEDLDDSDTTITFSTDKGTFTYSLIYK